MKQNLNERPLSLDSIEKLENIVKRSSQLQKSEVLFRAGDEFKGLYAMRSGLVKVLATADDGEEQIVGFFSYPRPLVPSLGTEKAIT